MAFPRIQVDEVSEAVIDAYCRYELVERRLAELTVSQRRVRGPPVPGVAGRDGPGTDRASGAGRAGGVRAPRGASAEAGIDAYQVGILRTFARFLFATGVTARDLSASVASGGERPFRRAAQSSRRVGGGRLVGLLRPADARSAAGLRHLHFDGPARSAGDRGGPDAVGGHRLAGGRDPGARQGRAPRPPPAACRCGRGAGGLPAFRSSCLAVLGRCSWRRRGEPAAISRHAVVLVSQTACQRLGIPTVGGHALRHTAATNLLRHGASLREVGELLRQSDAATTGIYAKVDRNALALAVRPWPAETGHDRPAEHLGRYLHLRRALGYLLPTTTASSWRTSSTISTRPASTTVTVEAALAWANQAPTDRSHASPALRGARLRPLPGRLRRAHPGPTDRLIRHNDVRPTPYIYSPPARSRALMTAANRLTPPVWAATMATRHRVDGGHRAAPRRDIPPRPRPRRPRRRPLAVMHSKHGKSRQIPLHPTTVDALGRYARLRDRTFADPAGAGFFLTASGSRPDQRGWSPTASAGWCTPLGSTRPAAAAHQPRLGDLRHSFAVSHPAVLASAGRRRATPTPGAVRLLGAQRAGPHLLVFAGRPRADGPRRRPARAVLAGRS